MNIFQISKDLQDIFAELEENDGELTDELEQKLAVSQADFKAKVKNYGEVIKQAEADIKLADEEIARLKAVKESKNKAIDRLKSVIVWAITMYGDTTKSGGKYIDYGTGKISIRNTEKVEVDTDRADTVVKDAISYIRLLNFTKELDIADRIDKQECIKSIIAESGTNISVDEFDNIPANFSFDLKLKDLLEGEGLVFLQQIFKVANNIKTKSNVSKTALKEVLLDDTKDISGLAKLVENKTVSIK